MNTTTADDFYTGGCSALRGGTTTVIDFACPNKGKSLQYGLDLWHKKADGRIGLGQMCRVLAENPARLYGLYPRKDILAPGSDADIVVYDPAADSVITVADQAANVDYAPSRASRPAAASRRSGSGAGRSWTTAPSWPSGAASTSPGKELPVKNAIRWVMIVLCLGVFCFAGYKILSTLLEYQKAEAFYEEAAGSYVVPETDSPEAPAVRKVQPEQGGPAAYVREDGEETAPITIDFNSLLADNGDVVGWRYCEDTPINYSVTQSSDNEDYLHRMLDGSSSSSGTIFLDCKCASDFSYDNSILYGHNMRNSSVFHN